jgi:hypothetical protein
VTDYNLFPAENGPATSTPDVGNQYTLGVRWSGTAGSPLWLKGYRVWRPADGGSPAVTGPISAGTWQVAGAVPLTGSDVTFVLAGSGWQQVLLPTPVPLALTTLYSSGGHFPNGAYPFTNSYWSSGAGAGGIANGRIVAPNQATEPENKQGSLIPGAVLTFPSSGSPGAANYWITPIITDDDPGGEFFEGAISIPVDVPGAVSGAKQGVGAVSTGVAVGAALGGSKASSASVSVPIAVNASVVGGDIGGAVVSALLCSAWATPADIPETIKAKVGISDVEWLGPLMRASELLYMMSGRRWLGGGCEETAVLRSTPPRPGEGTWPYHASWGACGCWVHAEWIDGQPYNLTHRPYGHVGQPFAVRLPRAPVTSVSSVKIDSVTFTGWQLLSSGWLERVDGKPWPVCGGLTEVTYQFGIAPPSGGRDAAVAWAVQIAMDWFGVEGCELPTRTTSVTRQNVTIEMASSAEILREGGTGVYLVDVWLRAVNPDSRPQRAGVWSPDVPRLSRRNA